MQLFQTPTETISELPTVDNRTRVLLLAFRQALLICLSALEDYLEMEHSVIPKHCKQ
jgi:hypothetical protein